MSTINCDADVSNISVSKCKRLPGTLKGMITAPANFKLTFENAADPAQWQTAIKAAKASRVYKWPKAVTFENTSEEAIYEESPVSTMNVRDGRYRFKLAFRENLEVAKEIETHKSDETAFLIDTNNQLIGWEVETGYIGGFTIDMINPENLMFNDGAGIASKKPVYISLADPDEFNKKGIMIDVNLTRAVALSDVEVTVVSAIATKIVVKVLKKVDNVAILGLDTVTPPGDFVLLDSGGSAQTITTITDNGDGTYDLDGAAFVSGTVNLKAASALSLDAYESTGAATVTIV